MVFFRKIFSNQITKIKDYTEKKTIGLIFFSRSFRPPYF